MSKVIDWHLRVSMNRIWNFQIIKTRPLFYYDVCTRYWNVSVVYLALRQSPKIKWHVPNLNVQSCAASVAYSNNLCCVSSIYHYSLHFAYLFVCSCTFSFSTVFWVQLCLTIGRIFHIFKFFVKETTQKKLH